jgi:hypothetical protein
MPRKTREGRRRPPGGARSGGTWTTSRSTRPGRGADGLRAYCLRVAFGLERSWRRQVRLGPDDGVPPGSSRARSHRLSVRSWFAAWRAVVVVGGADRSGRGQGAAPRGGDFGGGEAGPVGGWGEAAVTSRTRATPSAAPSRAPAAASSTSSTPPASLHVVGRRSGGLRRIQRAAALRARGGGGSAGGGGGAGRFR